MMQDAEFLDDQELPEDEENDENLGASVPMYPRFLVKTKPKRVLAYMDMIIDDGIYVPFLFTEGGETYRVESYAAFKPLCFRDNLLVFTSSVPSFPWLDEAIKEDQVMCTKKGTPTSIRLKEGAKTRWVGTFNSWDMEPGLLSIMLIRKFLDYLDVGDYPTIGAVGNATMNTMWSQYLLPRHTTMNGYAESFMREHMVGGRVDTPGLDNRYERLIEYDLTSAYLSNYTRQPTGTSVFFRSPKVISQSGHRLSIDQFVTYFASCTVKIQNDHVLPLGPFPLRVTRKGKPGVEYPTEPGEYIAYLWKEQVELCRGLGLHVSVHYGFGWWELTYDTEAWCEHMYQQKVRAPTKVDEELTKRAINAAIGRQAMAPMYYSLVSEEHATPDELFRPIVENGEAYPYYVRIREDFDSANMLHWNAYTLMKTSVQVFEMALPFARDRRLVCTNYDSVTVLPGDDPCEEYGEVYPKNSERMRHLTPGMWRWQELTNCWIKAPRSIICDQKDIQPGVLREERGL
jgi:hypothetical protein